MCGYKSVHMNAFINTRTNIINLQFGSDKCEKMHVGKKRVDSICPKLLVDSWKGIVQENDKGKKILKDIYIG